MKDSDLLHDMIKMLHFTVACDSIHIHILCHPKYKRSTLLVSFRVGKFAAAHVFSDHCRLVTGGIPEGHFTHIFVDEAGQATETECLIPLAGKKTNSSVLSVAALNFTQQ